MNKTEAAQLLTLIKTNYPNYNKDISPQETELLLNFWVDLFDGYDSSLVGAGLKSFMAKDTKGFAPVPGQIMAEIRNIAGQAAGREYLGAEQAWDRVVKAMSDSTYNSEKSFAALDAVTQSVVSSPAQLKRWCGMHAEQVETVIKSHFVRDYNRAVESHRQNDALPASVQALITQHRTGQAKIKLPFKDFNGRSVGDYGADVGGNEPYDGEDFF